jgi:hypothetical protein
MIEFKIESIILEDKENNLFDLTRRQFYNVKGQKGNKNVMTVN